MTAPLGVVVMGVCGAGKTTLGRGLAQRLGWAFVEGDELHSTTSRAKMSAGQALDDADRWPWLDRIAAAVAEHQARGESLVVACSALRRAYRERLGRGGAPLLFLHLEGGRDLLAARMAARRDHFMPPELLASQLATLEPPGPEENALRLDAAAAPERLVRQVCDHLKRHDENIPREGSP